jgi:hypothetical protein
MRREEGAPGKEAAASLTLELPDREIGGSGDVCAG